MDRVRRVMEITMRYLPLTPTTAARCWRASASPTIDALFADILADKLLTRPARPAAHARASSRSSASSARMAARNVAAGSVPFFVGAGAYKHHVPASVDHLIQRSEFLT